MNLSKLFEMQAALDTHIEHEHPRTKNENRLEKKILALLVELGELANEFRGFKFWSNNQKPRTWKRVNCPSCEKKGYERGKPPVDPIKREHALGNHWYYCDECAGHLVIDINPTLVEYVDCLHFALSIGLEIDFNINTDFNIVSYGNTLRAFNETFLAVSSFYEGPNRSMYRFLVKELLNLGTQLGFTWEQIEQAYIKKNEVNHQRQLNGY